MVYIKSQQLRLPLAVKPPFRRVDACEGGGQQIGAEAKGLAEVTLVVGRGQRPCLHL
ncbi:MAG: hypothetical protein IPL28_21480 [Chloroflexi bacterium]|nr:hypothetical protein [Chloroflexota bacterium]